MGVGVRLSMHVELGLLGQGLPVPSTHLCSSFRDTVIRRPWPRTYRAARMSAHCTISPRGPPFSTRGLNTSPDSSVRKPMWTRICGGTGGQHRGAAALGPATPGRPGQQQTLSPSWAWAGASWHSRGTKRQSDRTGTGHRRTQQSRPALVVLTFRMDEETTVNTDKREFHEMRGALKETDRAM